MTLPCYKCRNAGFPETQVDYVKETKEYFEPGTTTPHIHKTKQGGTDSKSYTSRPKIDYAARDANMQKMQEAKHAHELALQDRIDINAKLLSDSNNNIAIELAKVAEALMQFARSKKLEQ